MKGRKPTPLNLRVITGNPGKRRLPAPIQLEAGVGPPPDYLDETAQQEWRRVVAELAPSRIVMRPDRAALECYCTAYSTKRMADEHIGRLGGALLMRTASGIFVQNPWVGIRNRAMEIMHKFISEFGMTPVSRARVSAGAPDPGNNPFAKI